jgi:multidrug transporter EmrE-like cation transporter
MGPNFLMPPTDIKRQAIFVLLISVLFNAIGQILFKAARLAYPEDSLVSIFFHIETWLGFILYGLSAICWLWVLSRAQLSFAYPVLALSFPIVVALSAVLFGEYVSTLRWMGVIVIVLGVSLLAKT